MDVCVENVFITPSIEAINVIQATAEEKDRAASSGPHHEHQETNAEQEPVARGFSPADSSESGGTSGSCSGGGFIPAAAPRRATPKNTTGGKNSAPPRRGVGGVKSPPPTFHTKHHTHTTC